MALGVLSGSQLLVVVDATIVSVALGPIREGLGFSDRTLQWVVSAYTLAFGGLLLIGGRVADRFGHRRMFIIGAAVFGMSSLIGGSAGNQTALIGARALQGAGAAIMAPAAMALVMDVFPPGRGRVLALGVWASVTAAGTAVGSVLGGVLAETASWRWVLWINAPFALVVVVLGLLVLPRFTGVRTGSIDIPSAIAVTGGLTLMVYGLARPATHGWTSATLLILLASVALLVTFALLQTARRAPLVPVQILHRTVVIANVIGLIMGVAIYTLFFFVSLFLSTTQDKGPLYVGLAFVPMTAAVAVAARLPGAVAARVGGSVVTSIGVALVALGVLTLVDVHPGSGYATSVLPALVVSGFGLGLTFVPLTTAAMSSAGHADGGVASALFNAAQLIGGALGLALLTTMGAAAGNGSAPGTSAELTPDAWGPALLAVAALTGVAAVLARLYIQPAAVPPGAVVSARRPAKGS